MRAFAQELEALGHRVRYIRINDSENQHGFLNNLEVICKEFDIATVRYQLPDEYRLDQYFKNSKVPLIAVDSEHFLTKRDEVAALFFGKKTFLMETFYRSMRKKHAVLMEGGQPVGGQWNFDHDNRKKLPANTILLTTQVEVTDQTEVYQDIQRAQLKTIGEINPTEFSWTITRTSAVKLLHEFIEQALPLFGTYQDAMITQHWYVYHSRLSFALNVKLIGPLEVIRAVEQAYFTHPATYELNQVEGFIRQILGWRNTCAASIGRKCPSSPN